MAEASDMAGQALHSVKLPNGRLQVQVTRADWPLEALCGFAARNNPRRGFLFVSKVLGKHWPVTPQALLAAQAALAERLPAPTSNAPLLFIGLAETATGLAQGVFEHYLARHGEGAALYVQTTRYPFDDAEMLPFEERHSHATSLRLHWPETPALRAVFAAARQLVLIDDELSTGETFLSLTAAYRRVNPQLEQLTAVALTNFMDAPARASFVARAGVADVRFADLLEGNFSFERDALFQAPLPPAAQAVTDCRRSYIGPCSARFGADATLQLSSSWLDEIQARLPATGRMLVLGTGEFMHPANRLAQALALRGFDVRIQATSRSPILPGADITQRLELPDPYGEGIPNHLYNFVRSDYAAVLLCHETPANAELLECARRLDAIPLRFDRSALTGAA